MESKKRKEKRASVFSNFLQLSSIVVKSLDSGTPLFGFKYWSYHLTLWKILNLLSHSFLICKMEMIITPTW